LYLKEPAVADRSVRARAQEHVKREKQVMAECDCPFMVNLVTSFKDDAHLYMLMECIMGGELFTYLQARTATRSGAAPAVQAADRVSAGTCT